MISEELSSVTIKSLINACQVAIQTMAIQVEQLRERNDSLRELIININERHLRDMSDQWEYCNELNRKLEGVVNEKC